MTKPRIAVVGPNTIGRADLLHIVNALDALCFLLALRKAGKSMLAKQSQTMAMTNNSIKSEL